MESLKPFFEPLENLLDKGGTNKDIALIVISAISLIISFFFPTALPFDAAWVAVILCGVPIVIGALIALITEFDIKADVLVSIALIASLIVGEYFAAGEVAVIMQLGALLEELTVARAQKGIQKLVELTPRTARIVEAGGAEHEIPANDVCLDQVVRILPGETIPVDGVVITGNTSVDESAITGESMPVDKQIGCEVTSGTTNQFGAIDVRATRVGEDSSIQRLARLVQSADANKAKIVRLADKWATWVVVGALASALAVYLLTGEILRAVTVLVVFCPCSLVLATPTAIVAAIGNATNHGFLVKEGDALERLSKVTRVVFDKTGTITEGRPRVSAVVPCEGAGELTREELYGLVASAELRSEHPLGQAIVRCACEEQVAVCEPTSFEMQPGKGVAAQVSGHSVCVGNQAFIAALVAGGDGGAAAEGAVGDGTGAGGAVAGCAGAEGAAADVCARGASDQGACAEEPHAWHLPQLEELLEEGNTVTYVSIDGKMAGIVALSDTIRSEAAHTISQLNGAGASTVLLTGDSEAAARTIAKTAGIADVIASCKPEDKIAYIEACENNGNTCAMIGDGINDAPALRRAYTGIAMGGVGSDVAVEAADIAIVNNSIAEVPHLIALSRHMMRVIKANLTFSMTLNFVAIVLAFLAVLNPVSGALVHNCGSVFVIINSAFLLSWGKKAKGEYQ